MHRVSLLITNVALALAILAGPPSSAAAEDSRPNVLLIMADDLRDYGGVFTKRLAKTPNLDRLRSRGVTFANAFAQYPVCNPSRTSLLTGLRCEETGVVGNQTFFRDALPDTVTLPQMLRGAGWKAHSFGKIFHTANTGEAQRDAWFDIGKSWDVAQTFPPGSPHRQGDFKNLTGGKLAWCEVGMTDGPEDEQPDGKTAMLAIRSMRELSGAGQRWMIAAGFHRPHDPFHAPRKYFDLYPKESLPLHHDPEGMMPPPPLAISGGWTAVFAQFGDDERREFLRAYLAGVSFMDAQVGRLLDELDRLGLWKNTVVIFLGDHGYHLGERGWWNKNTLFDRSCRAPLIVAAPGAKEGKVFQPPVEFVDIYPTVADFCGTPAPHRLAGRSLRPVLEDPTRAHKAAAFTMVTRGERFGQSVRAGQWRFTRWSDGKTELYDHSADPEETRNLASHPEHRGTVAAMAQHLESLPAWPRN